jgi:hypothetical protein
MNKPGSDSDYEIMETDERTTKEIKEKGKEQAQSKEEKICGRDERERRRRNHFIGREGVKERERKGEEGVIVPGRLVAQLWASRCQSALL